MTKFSKNFLKRKYQKLIILNLFLENKNLSFSQELVGSFLDLVNLKDLKIKILKMYVRIIY